MEVVLEILLQSKEKATHLGLTETDIVMDQAIYAKAVEIVLIPAHEDLKKYCVLRLGAFHTSMAFLAVIGKRFSDAGLRDWIVESGILGNQSFQFSFFLFCNMESLNFKFQVRSCTSLNILGKDSNVLILVYR